MISDQITILNETTVECLKETDEVKIVANFTDVGLSVLGADFGFVWLNNSASPQLELVYKSSGLPFIPHKPRKNGRNYTAIKNRKPDFVTETTKTLDAQYVSLHIKSFVIIPLTYKESIYGSMVFCFKNTELFPREKKILTYFIGNSVAQAITINRLIISEKEAQKKALLSKNLERQLKEEKMKIEFIANINHELRTPLSIIKGNIDLALINKSKSTKSSASALRAIDQEVKHLSNIMSDLSLITSRKEEIESRISYSEISLNKLISNVVKRFVVLAKEKNISIKLTKFKDFSILGDEAHLEKMLANLVKNSIIYGKKNGHTTIVVSKIKSLAKISVMDDGIGVSKEDLPHLFERFYRADKSHNSDGNRTGLGLAIVKWVAEIHGGSATVKATLGEGSTFTVFIPLKPTKLRLK